MSDELNRAIAAVIELGRFLRAPITNVADRLSR
jgi:hypothetical protein